MAKNLQAGLRQSMKASREAGLQGDGVFSRAPLDLRFALQKTLDPRITFTRASSATFVDSSGVLRSAVTNLKTFSDAILTANGYSTPLNATLATVTVATPTTSSTATLLTLNVGANTGNSTDGFNYGTALTLANLTQHTQSLFVKPAGATVLRLRSNISGLVADFTLTGNGTAPSLSAELQGASIVPFANDWYRVSWTFTSTTSIPGNRSDYWTIKTNVADGTNGLYLVGAQLEQSSTVGDYVPTTSTINSAPRFDHNPTTGESLGLLVEEARTNLWLQSQFASSWTPTRATLQTNDIVAPDATMTGAKLIEDTTASLTHLITQSISVTSGTPYTVSVFVKATASPRFLQFIFPSSSFTNTRRPVFDLVNGTVLAATDTTASIQNFGNGWYRCIASMSATVTGSAALQLQLADTYTNATSNYTGNGVSGVYIWGAQVEAGAFPTSYIPTTTATVTRAADVASITGSSFSSWYNQTEGTVFAETQLQSIAARSAAGFDINDNSTNNRIVFRALTSSVADQVVIRSASSTVLNAANVLPAPTTASRKSAVGYKVNDFMFTAVGSAGFTGTTGAVPVSVNQMLIGYEQGPTGQLGGTIKRLTYWPTRLSNTVLQQITQP